MAFAISFSAVIADILPPVCKHSTGFICVRCVPPWSRSAYLPIL
jgi:hypothetical protein